MKYLGRDLGKTRRGVIRNEKMKEKLEVKKSTSRSD
jgi:hypothetical protein